MGSNAGAELISGRTPATNLSCSTTGEILHEGWQGWRTEIVSASASAPHIPKGATVALTVARPLVIEFVGGIPAAGN